MNHQERVREDMVDFCDLMCRYAQVPKDQAVDGSGSCRTFVALYCARKKSLVHKNMPCSDKALRTGPPGKQ